MTLYATMVLEKHRLGSCIAKNYLYVQHKISQRQETNMGVCGASQAPGASQWPQGVLMNDS